MKKYRVYAISEQRLYLDVEANNADEAWDIANETDGGEFTAEDEGSWDLEFEVEELKKEK